MNVVERYLELGLQLGRHIPGFVDSYYGPGEVRERAEAAPLPEPAELADAAGALSAELDGFEPQRRRWLRAQLTALQTVARRLAGAPTVYSDEVELCYGVRPRRVSEAEFEAAHTALEELLPGEGSIGDRYRAWLDAKVIPSEHVKPIVDSLAADLRERTRRLVGLPEGEEADVELVANEPWTAFNYYLGGLRSRIAVNTDLPTYSTAVAELITHEIYPGHHTEHATKEQLFVRDRGWYEESIVLNGTPSCLVSEGIAGVAAEVLLGESIEHVAAEHLARFGIELDAEEAAAVRRAREILGAAEVNAALLLHEDGASGDEAAAYLMTWRLVGRRRAEKLVEFMTDPVWRSYIATYTEGLRLCRSFLAGEASGFRRLVSEQLTPADLAGAAGA